MVPAVVGWQSPGHAMGTGRWARKGGDSSVPKQQPQPAPLPILLGGSTVTQGRGAWRRYARADLGSRSPECRALCHSRIGALQGHARAWPCWSLKDAPSAGSQPQPDTPRGLRTSFAVLTVRVEVPSTEHWDQAGLVTPCCHLTGDMVTAISQASLSG